MKYIELKEELKNLASRIRNGKGIRKPERFEKANEEQRNDFNWLSSNRYHFRHKHIAYCQLRGRKREEIEKPALDNLPNERYIKEIMAQYENVCACAERSA